MADLTDVTRLVAGEHGLTVVSTARADGSIQSSVVNAGVLDSPVDGAPVVGYVAIGGTRKLANLRERSQTTLVVRVGWEWVAVEGQARLIGPDDPVGGVDAERLRLLLREVFTSAGGKHDDFDEDDRVRRDERRTAVRITPTRVYSNR
jgi:PPOX class probable F420-dependent enzyme